MTREEEKYKAATESWSKQGFKNQEQKIPYEFGFLKGFDYADEHPRKGLWDAKKVIEWLRNNQKGFILTDIDIDDLRKAMED